ncbi:MAG: zf-HC2 domain-containing protein [Chroococcidiopsidaceae cyanobacterium CP_BM_ER_R8_30]|nr:zf-HC2 domain-containing protein [Chroococcidiopsidaceae cyanobacterium CP_BM_ER_R8_30]
MTSKFESQNISRTNSHETLPQSTLKRDRFELLSAYLDGEVSAAERRQVEAWLATDTEVQRLYGRLINLRQSLQTMPVPQVQQSAEQTVHQVFARLHRPWQAIAWVGAAFVAMFVGNLSGIVPTNVSSVNQVARTLQSTNKHETLLVALNTPVVEIPSKPPAPVKPVQSQPPQRIN